MFIFLHYWVDSYNNDPIYSSSHGCYGPSKMVFASLKLKK